MREITLQVTDYQPPACQLCKCATLPIGVPDERGNENGGDRLYALDNAGFCIACSTLIVRGSGAITYVEVGLNGIT